MITKSTVGRRSRTARLATALVLVAAGLAGGLVQAVPAAAATSCDFTFESLKARNLDKDNGSQTDYVWIQVEQRWFPSGGNGVAFQLNDTRYAGSFGNPTAGYGSNGLEVRVVLDKFPLNVTVERETIACDAVNSDTITFSNGDAVYDMVYSVTT